MCGCAFAALPWTLSPDLISRLYLPTWAACGNAAASLFVCPQRFLGSTSVALGYRLAQSCPPLVIRRTRSPSRSGRIRVARSQGVSDYNSEADCRMRSKNAALFAVGLLFVSFWLNGGARCQSPAAPPVSLAPPPSVTDRGSPPAATCHSTGLNRWCSDPAGPSVLSPRPTAEGSSPPPPDVPMNPPSVIRASPPAATDDVPAPTATAKRSPPPPAKNVPSPAVTDDVPPPAATAKRSPPPATKNVSPPIATDELPPPTATAKRSTPPATKNVSPPTVTDDGPPRTATAKGSARSAAAKNSPPPANNKDAPAPAVDNILPSPAIDKLLPTPRVGKLSPSREPGPDGLIPIDDGEETGQPLPIGPSPGKKSKVRQKPDVAERPLESLGDQAEVDKLKPNLKICQGC